MPIALLNRSLIRLSGEGVMDWFSGLITNTLDDDINFAAMLTPQGKIIADFFVVKEGNDLLVDTAEKFRDGLMKRLSMYRLRAPIIIGVDDRNIYGAWNGTGDEGFTDPRHDKLGQRILADYMECEASEADYNQHRLSLGIPDSQYDFETSAVFPANANMDLLAGVNFKKGCFVGQEVVSRMYRKTEIKKRMRGFTYSGKFSGEQIKLGDRVVGDVMYSSDNYGMAMVRQDRLPSGLADEVEALKVGDIEITLLDLPAGKTEDGNTP